MFKEAFVLFLTLYSMPVDCENDIHITRASSEKAFEGVVYKDKVLKSETNVSLIRCTKLCIKLHTCVSFFYNSRVKFCQVHSVVFNDSLDGILESGWKYYAVEEIKDSNSRNYCPQEWKLFNGYCYFFNHVDIKSWEETKTYCEQRDGKLVEINSQEEQDFIRSEIKTLSGYWLGGYDIDDNDNWVWQSTGQSFQYTAWASEAPYNFVWKPGQCLGSYGFQNFLWNDFECKLDFHAICEKKAL